MSRTRVAIGRPDPSRDWSSFPAERSSATRVFRAHSTTNGPWFFSSDVSETGGRFDLEDPEGTCYLAASVDVARFGSASGRPTRSPRWFR